MEETSAISSQELLKLTLNRPKNKNRLHLLIESQKHLQKVHKNYPNLFCIGYKNMQSSEKMDSIHSERAAITTLTWSEQATKTFTIYLQELPKITTVHKAQDNYCPQSPR